MFVAPGDSGGLNLGRRSRCAEPVRIEAEGGECEYGVAVAWRVWIVVRMLYSVFRIPYSVHP